MYELPIIISIPLRIIETLGWNAFFGFVGFVLYAFGLYKAIRAISHSQRPWGRLVRGEYGLPITFWLYGSLVNFLSSFLFEPLLRMIEFGGRRISGAVLVLVVMAAFLVYWPVWMVGMWRAADAYTGPTIWRVLARLHAALSIPAIAFGFWYSFRTASLLLGFS